MKKSIVITFKYYGDLAGKPKEYDPSLMWRNTTCNNFETGCRVTELEWEDEEHQISKEQTLIMSFNNTMALSRDTNIWVQCIAKTINNEGRICKELCGSLRISFFEVIDCIKSRKSYKKRVIFTLPTLVVNDVRTKKGYADIECSLCEKSDLQYFEFETSSNQPIDYLDLDSSGNAMNQTKYIMEECTNSLYYPYDLNYNDRSNGISCSDPVTEKVRCPLYTNIVTTPGLYYWLHVTEYNNMEYCLDNIVQIALNRTQRTREWFIRTCDDQFSANWQSCGEDFILCCVVVSRALCLLSNSTYYKSDEVYVRNSKNAFEKKSIESFSDPLLLSCADCEDMAVLIHRIARMIEVGDPTYKNDTDLAFKHGSWQSELLKWTQKILHIYVCVGTLGTIRGSKVENQNNNSNILSMDATIKETDNTIGGHMWCELIPVVHFEYYVNKCSSYKGLKIFPTETPKHWEIGLPHMVAEGTGALYPLLKPMCDYHPDEEAKYKNLQKQITHCIFYVTSNDVNDCLELALYDKMPSLLESKSNTRYNDVYIKSSSIFTDKLIREGYDVGEFMWIYGNGQRSAINNSRWQWGVEMKHKLDIFQRDVQLLTVPAYTEEEWELLLALGKQMFPLKYPQFSIEERNAKEKKYKIGIEQFNKRLSKITQNRHTLPQKKTQTIYIVYNAEEIFNSTKMYGKKEMTLQDAFIKHLSTKPNICSIVASMEYLPDNMSNVRIDVSVSIEPNFGS